MRYADDFPKKSVELDKLPKKIETDSSEPSVSSVATQSSKASKEFSREPSKEPAKQPNSYLFAEGFIPSSQITLKIRTTNNSGKFTLGVVYKDLYKNWYHEDMTLLEKTNASEQINQVMIEGIKQLAKTHPELAADPTLLTSDDIDWERSQSKIREKVDKHLKDCLKHIFYTDSSMQKIKSKADFDPTNKSTQESKENYVKIVNGLKSVIDNPNYEVNHKVIMTSENQMPTYRPVIEVFMPGPAMSLFIDTVTLRFASTYGLDAHQLQTRDNANFIGPQRYDSRQADTFVPAGSESSSPISSPLKNDNVPSSSKLKNEKLDSEL